MTTRTLQVLINGALDGHAARCRQHLGVPVCRHLVGKPRRIPSGPVSSAIHRLAGGRLIVAARAMVFDNLLPEELMRQVLAKEVNVESADAFGMLERMGMESAGALVLQAEGAPQPEKACSRSLGKTCLNASATCRGRL